MKFTGFWHHYLPENRQLFRLIHGVLGINYQRGVWLKKSAISDIQHFKSSQNYTNGE